MASKTTPLSSTLPRAPAGTRSQTCGRRGHGLPDPTQTWAHGTVSRSLLRRALHPESGVTAIEADVLMCPEGERAVMAHPPSRESDLEFEEFLLEIMAASSSPPSTSMTSSSSSSPPSAGGLHHVKIDFKEIEVVPPCLGYIRKHSSDLLDVDRDDDSGPGKVTGSVGGGEDGDGVSKTRRRAVFLNANVLEGPGCRGEGARVDHAAFLGHCTGGEFASTCGMHMAYSLGWAVDPRAFSGYTFDDVRRRMRRIVADFDLDRRSAGIVFAVNARVLSKDVVPFHWLMSELPDSQLLVWTATGEPPISRGKLEFIRACFVESGTIHRVGFDCNVCTTFWSGLFFEIALRVVSVYWYIKKWASAR